MQSGKFFAEITVKGKIYRSERVETTIEAAIRYNELAVEHFGEFAKLNRIGGEDLGISERFKQRYGI